MANAPMNAPLAPYLSLGGGYSIAFTALNPTTGAVVTAVKVSNATISIDRPESIAAPPFHVLPPYTQGEQAV